MAELWIPGAAGPSLDDFIARLHKRIELFAAQRGGGKVAVEVQLHDGSTLKLLSVSPEPGYGFITLCPHCESEDEPEELIVPVGSIVRLRLGRPEEHLHFGFSPPEQDSH